MTFNAILEFTFGPVDQLSNIDVQLFTGEGEGHAQWVGVLQMIVLARGAQELFDPVGDPGKQPLTGAFLQLVRDGPFLVNDIKLAIARECCPADTEVGTAYVFCWTCEKKKNE